MQSATNKLSSIDLDTLTNFFVHTFSYSNLKLVAVYIFFLLILWLFVSLILSIVRTYRDIKDKFVFLEITPPHTTEISSASTTQLFSLIANLISQRTWLDRLLFRQPFCSLEIVSAKETGIRYILRIPENIAKVAEKNLRSYIPSIKVKEIADYLPAKPNVLRILEFKHAKHFALPLNEQSHLEKHDPLAYLTGNMTQLKKGELMALQVILRPLNGFRQMGKRQEISRIKSLIAQNKFSLGINDTKLQSTLRLIAGLIESAVRIVMMPLLFLAEFASGQKADVLPHSGSIERTATTLDIEMGDLMKSKLHQPLFAGTVRALLVMAEDQILERERGLRSSFASFLHSSGQSLIPKWRNPVKIVERLKWLMFRLRLSGSPLVLATSEVSALYHFPYTANTHTEDLVRVKSRDLPAPLVLKNNQDLDVVFGKSTYGNVVTDIGLTDEDRSRHLYLIGQTGSGKSTIIYHMASDDIKKGRGLAVIDPHGDLAEGLLDTVPKERTNDLIYFNPRDIKFPVGINLLELDESLEEDDLELEKELVCESVISIFRRVFFKDEDANAHRIEYILRNTIHTAFVVPDRTIFTVYHLLNDQNVRRQAIRDLKNEDLINFWKNEFGKAGDYQHVKMIGGITAKVGRFLFSATARRILEQSKSTISFDDILDSRKILICNLAEGKLGEDTSQLLGATVLAKIQQAAVRRARMETAKRQPFYLFVDEFQNFANKSFTKFLSGGRKFGLRITVAEQSTAQQDNKNVTNVVLANTGTVICFRTASPVDEDLMLSQFAPAVVQGDIGNLPRYRFYMKMAAVEPQEPLSGETIPITTPKNPAKVKSLIESSRKNYAVEYVKPVKKEMPGVQSEPSAKTGPKKANESAPAGLNSYR
ncbi:MAG: type IV secretion system DNA-binding domain-containing protein [bacterium]|nr:type IV secretion system DNA-binding domain-containing protein [bacterium]